MKSSILALALLLSPVALAQNVASPGFRCTPGVTAPASFTVGACNNGVGPCIGLWCPSTGVNANTLMFRGADGVDTPATIPPLSGQSGKVLGNNGTSLSWVSGGGGSGGVTSLIAGGGITVSAATGDVTLGASGIAESSIANLTTDLAAKATDTLAAHLAGVETFTGVKTFNVGTLKINNSAGTFATTFATLATATRTWTVPDATDTAVGLATALGGDLTGTVGAARIANPGPIALTDASSIATDASLVQKTGGVFTVTLGGNRTLANPTNLQSGATYIWIVTQDGSGLHTLAYGNLFAWPSATAPTLSTTAAYVDLITCAYDGIKLRCVFTGDVR